MRIGQIVDILQHLQQHDCLNVVLCDCDSGPTVAITKDNVKTIMLLEVLKDIDDLTDSHINASECLKNYVSRNRIRKSMVDRILPNYPLRTYKAIYDMELTSVLT